MLDKTHMISMLRKGQTGDEILMILDAITAGESEESEQETED